MNARLQTLDGLERIAGFTSTRNLMARGLAKDVIETHWRALFTGHTADRDSSSKSPHRDCVRAPLREGARGTVVRRDADRAWGTLGHSGARWGALSEGFIEFTVLLVHERAH